MSINFTNCWMSALIKNDLENKCEYVASVRARSYAVITPCCYVLLSLVLLLSF